MASSAFPLATNFDPAFGDAAEKLRAAAAAQGITTHYESGVRSKDDQAQLYANMQAGRAGKPLPYPNRGAVPLAAVPGTSMHEKGLAADIVADDPAQQAKLRALGAGFGLRTLGTRDPDHFELAAANIPKGGGTPGTYAYGGGGTPPDGGTATAFAPTPVSPAASSPAVAAINTATHGTTINAANTPVAGALAAETGPETVGAGAPVAATEGPLDTRQLVYNKLTAAGLAPHQALGALYGLGGESHPALDTTAYNPKDPGGAIGIAQWNGPRRAALEAFAKDRGTSVADPNTQADFLVDELTNKNAATYQPGVFAKMQNTQNAADATKTWVSSFERPKVNNWQARFNQGSAVGTLDNNNQFVLGTSPSSNTSGGTAVAATGPTNTTAAPAAPPTDDRPWYAKAFGALMEGKDGKKSPFDKFSEALVGGDKAAKEAVAAQAPESSALTSSGPGARNVSPGLQNVAQTYGQTLNSFSQPLTWNSAPPQAPNLPAAGLQPTPATQVPGISLNSVQPSPYGVGYGINPVGYGFG